MLASLRAAFLSALLIPCLWSCEGEDEPAPAFLYLEAITVNTTTEQGSSRVRVPQGQLFVGEEYIGIVQLPGRVPVLQTGEQELRLDPLVRDNGSTGTLALFPFYERITTTVNLEPLRVDTVQLETTYADNRTDFAFVESFDSPGILFSDDRDGNDQTAIVRVEDGALEGQSGRFTLTTDNPFIEVATPEATPYAFANANAGVYLEMDFKADIPFQVGLIGREAGLPAASQYNYQLAAREEWTKIYLNLGPEVFASDFAAYQIGIRGALPETETSASVYLDNIKLLRFR